MSGEAGAKEPLRAFIAALRAYAEQKDEEEARVKARAESIARDEAFLAAENAARQAKQKAVTS